MGIRVVQLGSDRVQGEELRIGTVRRPPRGVPRSEYARRNFYDVWMPDIAPSTEIIDELRAAADPDAGWRRFERRYRSEMKQPVQARLLKLLAAMSHTASFSVGCYCANERRCHRSILERILREHGAKLLSR